MEQAVKMPEVAGRYRGQSVGVLCGGLSSEREISERTAQAVLRVLKSRDYRVSLVSADREVGSRLASANVDVVFNALHGRYGEDGCIQGLLETLALPYTGAGVLGSAVSMDKWMARAVLDRSGLPTAPAVLVGPADEPGWDGSFPVVVKPRGEGSSNGVALVRAPEGLAAAVAGARAYDRDVLIEEFIPGREVTVAILDDQALSAMEVVALGDDFHSYEVKYTAGREEFVLPAPLGELYQPVLDVALASHQALLAGPYSRVDLRVRPDGGIFVLECNTLPGLHELGWFPAMAAHVGIEFGDLIEILLDRAAVGVRETRREEG